MLEFLEGYTVAAKSSRTGCAIRKDVDNAPCPPTCDRDPWCCTRHVGSRTRRPPEADTRYRIIELAYRSDAKPFSFASQNGEPDGYTIDLCKFIASALGRDLNKKISTEWVPVDSQNRFDSIAAGVADIECGSSSVSFGRMTKVDFSSFIFMENTGLIVRVNAGISSFGDLKGKKIAVIVGTTNEAALTKEIQRRQVQTAAIRVRTDGKALPHCRRRRGRIRQR